MFDLLNFVFISLWSKWKKNINQMWFYPKVYLTSDTCKKENTFVTKPLECSWPQFLDKTLSATVVAVEQMRSVAFSARAHLPAEGAGEPVHRAADMSELLLCGQALNVPTVPQHPAGKGDHDEQSTCGHAVTSMLEAGKRKPAFKFCKFFKTYHCRPANLRNPVL